MSFSENGFWLSLKHAATIIGVNSMSKKLRCLILLISAAQSPLKHRKHNNNFSFQSKKGYSSRIEVTFDSDSFYLCLNCNKGIEWCI